VAKIQLPSDITWKQFVRFSGIAAGGAIVLVLLLFILVWAGVFGHIATVEELQKIQNYQSSEIYSNDQVLLGKYYYQDRTEVQYRELPDHLINALVATEDARFYSHHGIDGRSTLRVIFKSILFRNRRAGGGSTLHQQLAKNLYPRKKFFLISMPVNKFREMIIGVRLDRAYAKDKIIELYLNTVSFGENTYGIESASQRFFNKEPGALRMEESALLVGMLKGTYIYNPRYFPEKAKIRRNTVLGQMKRYGYIDSTSLDSLSTLPVELDYLNLSHNEGPAPYFREHLRQVLLEWAKNNPKPDGSHYNIYTDGLKIYTTINSDLQAYAEAAMKNHMSRLQGIFDRQWKNRDPWGSGNSLVISRLERTEAYKKLQKQGMARKEILDSLRVARKMEIFTWQGMKEVEMSPFDSVAHYLKFLHAGLLSVEARTGYVRAWVGGINSRYFKYDHVTSERQPGSVFKPILYTAALENGMNPCSYFENDSVVYEAYNNWTPRNADGEYGGYYSMKGALTHSVNTVSVKILEETGIEEVIRFAKKLGISGELPEVPSLALGTGNVSLEELIRAYTIFLNDGQLMEPVFLKRIEDQAGNILYTQKTIPPVAMIDSVNAKIMTEMMKGVVDNGTASSLREIYGFTNEIAGKTGTSQNYSDGWFIGYNPVLITGVWVGGDLPSIRFRYGGYGSGAAAALPIWARYMQKIYRDPLYRNSKDLRFEVSDSIKNELDCDDYLESFGYMWWRIKNAF